jgi:hypothetical protein
MPTNAWTSLTKREHNEAWFDAVSPGGASLQACALVLLFAMACEWSYRDGQRSGWTRDKDGSVVVKPGMMRITYDQPNH